MLSYRLYQNLKQVDYNFDNRVFDDIVYETDKFQIKLPNGLHIKSSRVFMKA